MDRSKKQKRIFVFLWSLFLIASLIGIPCRVRKSLVSDYVLVAY
jgi:hypothetical protein